MTSQSDDQAASASSTLVARVRLADARAWEQLTELYGPLVYHWCRQAGLASRPAAEAVQQVFQSVLAGEIARASEARGTLPDWLREHTNRALIARGRPIPKSASSFEASLSFAIALESETSTDASQVFPEAVLAALERIRSDIDDETWQAFWKTTLRRVPAAEVAREMDLPVDVIHQARSTVLRRLRQSLSS